MQVSGGCEVEKTFTDDENRLIKVFCVEKDDPNVFWMWPKEDYRSEKEESKEAKKADEG